MVAAQEAIAIHADASARRGARGTIMGPASRWFLLQCKMTAEH